MPKRYAAFVNALQVAGSLFINLFCLTSQCRSSHSLARSRTKPSHRPFSFPKRNAIQGAQKENAIHLQFWFSIFLFATFFREQGFNSGSNPDGSVLFYRPITVQSSRTCTDIQLTCITVT